MYTILPRRFVASCIVGVGMCIVAAHVAAQDLAVSTRAPRFLEAMSPRGVPVEIDARQNALLRQVVSLDVPNPTVGRLFAEIERQTGLHLGYSREALPADRVVTLQAAKITVGAALVSILMDSGLDVLLSPHRQVTLVERAGRHRVRIGTIVGRVTDAQTSQPLSAANVMLKDTKSATVTDSAGRYRLADVEAGRYTLIARRIGYAKREQAVTVGEGEDTVNIALEPQATRLGELVTTATGRRRRVELANDITLIKADSVVRTQPITSVTDLLEGRVPGLTVQRTSGAPGDPARLRLRGAASPLRGNDPIVIVDGVRRYAEQSAVRSGNLAAQMNADNGNRDEVYATPSPLDYIDPNSIETIEVVKGPSAATLYGQDAANGVIVITTKKGRPGPSRWTAMVDHGQTRMAGDYPELFFRWGHEPDDNTPIVCPVGNLIIEGNAQRRCEADSVVTFQMLNDPALTVLDKGHRTGVTLGVSGGTQALTYAVTGSYREELGLVKLPDYAVDLYQSRLATAPPDWMRRPQRLTHWGATSNVTARLGATADVTLSTNLARTVQQRSSLERQLGALTSTYLDRASGTYYRLNTFNNVSSSTDGVLKDYYERVTGASTAFTNGLNLNWRPRSWLTVTSDAGLNVIQRADETFLPRRASPAADDSVGRIATGQGTSLQSTVNMRANAVAPVGAGFQFRFAVGANYAGLSIEDVAARSIDLPPGTSLQGSRETTMTRAKQNDATFGWYAEPSIGNDKFNFTSGLRLDQGGIYGSDAATPVLPKLGFSYVVSDESFFPFKDLVPVLKLRVAYGRAPRQPGPADRLRLYGRTQQELADGQFVSTVGLQTLGNTQLRPERSTEIEGGFDAELLQNRLNLSFTAYRKTTEDALVGSPVAPSVNGGGSILRNIGVIRNTGMELTLWTQLVRSAPVTWGTEVSFIQNRNVVVELGPGVEPFYTNGNDGTAHESGSGLRVAPGYPLFGRWSKPVLGYADVSGNGVLEPSELLLGDTAVYVGQTLPNYTAQIRTTVSLWRGAVALSAGFLYEDGLAQRNDLARSLSVFGRARNEPGSTLAEQAAVADFGSITDYNWIQTVNTMRFNDLAVRVAIPNVWARWLGASRLSIALQGTNLGLWTNYRGLDPSVNSHVSGNDVSDNGVLPQSRSWQLRLNADF